MNHLDVVEMKQALSGLATISRHYYLELRRQGFSRREAFLLTKDWHQSVLGSTTSE